MKTPFYKNEHINCTCGHVFHADLEEDLSDKVWESTVDFDRADEQQYTCPNCNRSYNLEMRVEKAVEVVYQNLTDLGQWVKGHDGEEIDLSILRGKWEGDSVFMLLDEYDDEEKVNFPNGTYIEGEKEYKVQDGIVESVWGITDENQLTLEDVIA